ncbi:MAG: hypothetical protein GY847_17375 [Proteobacteria bacterium]|nr:hypothetical protein [Pseudomonadota bacterium]
MRNKLETLARIVLLLFFPLAANAATEKIDPESAKDSTTNEPSTVKPSKSSPDNKEPLTTNAISDKKKVGSDEVMLEPQTASVSDEESQQVTETEPADTEPTSPSAPFLAAKKSDSYTENNTPKKSLRDTSAWSLVGIAGATLISGGIFGLTAMDEKHRIEDSPSDEFDDRHKSRALAAYISLGIAGAAAAAALIVWLTGKDEKTESVQTTIRSDGTSLTVAF